MEDADSDAEMADYGTDFSDDVDQNFDARTRHVWPGISRAWSGHTPDLTTPRLPKMCFRSLNSLSVCAPRSSYNTSGVRKVRSGQVYYSAKV